MNDLKNLELAFHERMRQIHEQARTECDYKATRFIQMVNADGGLQTAKKLLASKGYSEGLTRLWEEKRLDISMEATVLKDPWCDLFTEEELSIARKKLEELGYLTNG
jgi:hypothetical protein